MRTSVQGAERTLLYLTARSLFGQAAPPADAPGDLEGVMALARRHGMTALIYPGLQACGNVSAQVLEACRRTVIMTATHNEELLREQDAVLALLSGRHIPCAILKGSSAAVCYPYPELRALGDIDLLIPEAERVRAGEALTGAGYRLESEHDFHARYCRGRATVEVHRAVSRLPDTAGGARCREVMREALDHTVTEREGAHLFPALDVPDQLTALLLHMARHMTASGLSLRQLCDWAVTVHRNRKRIDARTLEMLGSCGLLRYAREMTRLCTVFLGLPSTGWSEEGDDASLAELMADVLDGRFFMQADRDHSALLMPPADGRGETRMLRFVRAANRKAQREFPWASRVALPLFWLYYPARWWVERRRAKEPKKRLTDMILSAGRRGKLYRRMRLFRV